MSQEIRDLETQHGIAINELEVRLQKLEALVKGLTDEVLDLKAVIWNIQKENRTAPVIREVSIPDENRPSPVLPIITATPIVVDPLDGTPSHVPSPHSPPISEKTEKKEENIVMKMQPDGTLRPTEEDGEEIIVASALDSRMKDGDKKKTMHDIIVADE